MNDQASFLPEDYLAQKADRRTNIVCLVLFALVMFGVIFAFVVTNQKWSQVKRDNSAINARYQTAAQQITELTELEEQKNEMLQKADLAAALVERVPRSILLAELINRMPERLSLLELELKSEKIKPAISRNDKKGGKGGRLKPERAKTKREAEEDQRKVRPPRYEVSLSLVGVAPTDLEVSRFLAELNAYTLLREVTLDYSEQSDIEGQTMRKFEIKMKLDTDADVREIDPLIVHREVRDPMGDGDQLYQPGHRGSTVQAGDSGTKEGH